MKLLNSYKNGNVKVRIYDDGTRILENDLDYFDFDFPLSMDCKITNKCPYNCPMCHEKSTADGEVGDIMNAKFINKLHAGTEIAIGGGAVTSHPDLLAFLEKLKKIGVIANITVSQQEYIDNKDFIGYLVGHELIHGLGISFKSKDDEVWNNIKKLSCNIVVHLIAGIHAKDVFDYLMNRGLKILVLGYKHFGRGNDFYDKAKAIVDVQLNWLKDNIDNYLYKFEVISFDNLALKQLEIQKHLTKEQWEEFYQGGDGTATMYVDLVKQQFAKTSTSEIRYPLLSNIKDMFKIIKEETNIGGINNEL